MSLQFERFICAYIRKVTETFNGKTVRGVKYVKRDSALGVFIKEDCDDNVMKDYLPKELKNCQFLDEDEPFFTRVNVLTDLRTIRFTVEDDDDSRDYDVKAFENDSEFVSFLLSCSKSFTIVAFNGESIFDDDGFFNETLIKF